ncbi:MAG: ABC transporter ATP-binding protein [Myxococcota bacterium]
MTTPALEFRGVSKRFGDRLVLDAIEMCVPRGETTVLLGPSGTGKSTLLRLAVGLTRPDTGSVFALGEEVFALGAAGLLRLRRRFGMLFQDGALFGSLTVGANVGFPLKQHLRLPSHELEERVEGLLELVGLAGYSGRMPSELSGGQRKRVALARAIALEPEMVLFDEPTSGLDPQTSAAIDALINDMQARLGLTFVVITHDVQSAATIAHHVGLLHNARLRLFGKKDEVLQSKDEVVRSFLDRRPPPDAEPRLR